jgi:glutamate--cysteine ligase
VTASADTGRQPERLLELPRYDAMEAFFDRVGPYGRLMMTNTAATQVALDAGRDGGEVGARWSLLHEAGPALVAAFACSPVLRGAPAGAWASQRMRTWLELDPRRTRGPVLAGGDPAAEYAGWALEVPLLCVRSDGDSWSAPTGASFADWVEGRLDAVLPTRPGVDDLELHLSTLFPPVRACGHLEVRYLDAQPGGLWRVPVAALEALLSTPAVLDRARELVAPTVGRWRDAARLGLADPALRTAGAAVLALAADHTADPALAGLVHHAATRTAAGTAPQQEVS